MLKKFVLLLLFVILVAGFFYFGFHHLLTLSALKSSVDKLNHAIEQAPLFSALVFFAFYVAVTALSLPGAAIMTLAAGALFGLWQGVLIASFASSIGALLAFMAARYLLRDTVTARFTETFEKLNAGVEKQGAFYLFTLRLVPIFPFFLINLLMGLTSIKARSFYWVSQLGMLAGTFVYINAGTQLGQLESLSGILSMELLLSFALLGIFPWIAKAIVAMVQRRQVYQGWDKPKAFDRNMIVIGAGAGGLVTSYIAAATKAKVTLVEAGEMGGDCLNYGCVPSKALIKSAKVAEQFRNAGHYGLKGSAPAFSFKQVMQRVHQVIADIAPHDSVERYTDLGVEVIKGYARLLDPWTVEISSGDAEPRRMTARTIVIATGASPFVPPLPGIESSGYVTSDTLWHQFAKLDAAPERLLVLGGGPIGCELAQSFSRLGSEVTLIEMSEQIMGREDADVAELAKAALIQSGVHVLTSHKALCFEQDRGNKQLVVEFQGKRSNLIYDQVICAVGRQARLEGYGLEALGIEANRTIETNPYLQTRYPNIYAVGDVAGPYQFTHVAAHQAWYASVNGLFGAFKKFVVDYRVIPWSTFIDPEVARVGLNEQEAKARGLDYEVTRFDFEELDRAITESSTQGFIKVITPKGKDKILGVTIVSDHAGDLIAEFVLAMKHNLGLNKVLGTIHTYPTWAEGNKYVAGNWKRNHAPEGVLKLVERYHTWRRN